MCAGGDHLLTLLETGSVVIEYCEDELQDENYHPDELDEAEAEEMIHAEFLELLLDLLHILIDKNQDGQKVIRFLCCARFIEYLVSILSLCAISPPLSHPFSTS